MQTTEAMSKIRKALDAKIKMFKAVATLYLTYKARFDVVLAMAANMTTFSNRNAVIDGLVPLASEDTKAMTDQRDALQAPLFLSAAVVANAVYSYADSIGDLVLKGEMNWTVAKLDKLSLDQLGPNCTAIHEKGVELLVQAGPFGLDQDKLDKLEADNTAWIALESGTRNKQIEISGYKRLLAKNVAENMKLLTDRLDGMVFTLSETDAALVELWNLARIIVPLPSTETQAKVTVKDIISNAFIYAAEVQLVNGQVNTAITNVSGEAEFKPIKQGYYLFKVMAAGYKPYEVIQQRLLKGKINRLEVALEPLA